MGRAGSEGDYCFRSDPAEQEGQRYDWDELCDAPLGLPVELLNRVSDPGMPPIGDRGPTHEPVTSQKLRTTPVSQAERETDRRSSPSGETSRGVIGEQRDMSQAQETMRRSRIPTPDSRRTDATRDRKESTPKRDQRTEGSELTTRKGEVLPPQKMPGAGKNARTEDCTELQ